MSEQISILTPCSRPENLDALRASIRQVLSHVPHFWYVIFDGRKVTTPPHGSEQIGYFARYASPPSTPEEPEKDFAAGFLRNVALEGIAEGWIYCLDDDNILHHDFDQVITNHQGLLRQDVDLICFKTERANGHRHIRGDPYQAMDSASFVWRRQAFPDAMFNPYGTTCDNELWRELWAACPPERREVQSRVAGYYNYLRK